MASDKQILAARLKIENLGNPSKSDGEILKEAGYSDSISKRPDQVTKSAGYLEVLNKYLPDDTLARKHKQLLNHKVIDHMVFPLSLSDEEITDMVESVGSKVKKIQHGEAANHVWYFVMNYKATQAALDMAYKIKGAYIKENAVGVNINFGVIVLPELNG